MKEIFDFLKTNYDFVPNLFTLDLERGCYLAVSEIFPKCRIYPCYFLIICRFVLHLNNLKSKNTTINRAAQKLFLNMKILLLIEENDIEDFFNKIKKSYYLREI